MIMLDLKQQQKRIKNYMAAASMKGLKQQLWIAAKMVNAQCPVIMVKIVAKKVQQWIVVKMANAPKKDIVVLIAARNHNNHF